jgi:hypothetical protein
LPCDPAPKQPQSGNTSWSVFLSNSGAKLISEIYLQILADLGSFVRVLVRACARLILRGLSYFNGNDLRNL